MTSSTQIGAKGPMPRRASQRVPGLAAESRKRERKTYVSRLPVSGQGRVGQTAYERRKVRRRRSRAG